MSRDPGPPERLFQIGAVFFRRAQKDGNVIERDPFARSGKNAAGNLDAFAALAGRMAWLQGQSYSEDLRARVLAAVDGGMAVRAAAKLFGISVSYIYKALIRRRRTGEAGASTRRGHRPRKLSPAQEVALAEHIAAYPDITLAALQRWLLSEHGVRLSNGAMWSAVARLGLSFKKRRSGRASRTVRMSRRGGASGRRRGRLSMPTSSSSSTRPAPAPR